MKKKDLTGMKFGDWQVLKYVGNKKYLCRCSCEAHTEREVAAYSLTSGKSTSCGHSSSISKIKEDLTNRVFGKLTVVGFSSEDHGWICECSCKYKTRLVVKRSNLISGKTTSCNRCAHKKDYSSMLGMKNNDWEVIGVSGDDVNRITVRCVCGVIQNMPVSKFKSSNGKCGHNKTSLIDLTDKYINDLHVLKRDGPDHWLTQCKCGMIRSIRSYELHAVLKGLEGYTNFYKCNHAELFNKSFGELTVIERVRGKQIKCKCSCGNIVYVSVGNLLNGSTQSCGCKKAKKIYTEDEFKSLINQYIQDKGELPFIDDIVAYCNIAQTTAYKYINNYNLRHLLNSKFASHYEKEIYNLVPNATLHRRNLLQDNSNSIFEIDIFSSDKNIGIEFNGNYWHSELYKDKYYHLNKVQLANKNGIRLIHIYEYEVLKNKQRIYDFIADLFCDKTKIYARNTEIKFVDTVVEREFLNRYHVQGYTNSQLALGLYYNNQLCMLMTFVKPRFNSNYEWEILRLCARHGMVVVGGAQKLFAAFINEYTPTSVVSYCNIDKFTGGIYDKLGFSILSKNIEPNYVWFNNITKDVLTRYQCQKHKLIENGFVDANTPLSENDIMYSLNYNKIYDSGNITYVWSKS